MTMMFNEMRCTEDKTIVTYWNRNQATKAWQKRCQGLPPTRTKFCRLCMDWDADMNTNYSDGNIPHLSLINVYYFVTINPSGKVSIRVKS